MRARCDRAPRPDPLLCASVGLLLIASLALSGCRATPGDTVVDGIGRRVAIPERIERIVTLAPNVTELVAAAGGVERIVGVDSESDFPPQVRALPKVGTLQPSLEAIAALRPDLVIASTSGNPASIAPPLEALGIPLYVVRTERVEHIPEAVRTLAALLGSDPAIDLAAIDRLLDTPSEISGPRPRVLLMLWPEPLYVAGRETFVDDLLRLAGAENAVEVEGWPAYSLEALMQAPPDIILYPRDAVSADTIAKLADTNAVWSRIPAVREGRVIPVQDDLVMRPGPRVVQGLEEIERAIRGAGSEAEP